MKFGIVRTLDDIVNNINPCWVSMRQFRNSPIAAIHHPVKAKAVDDMRYIGLDLGGLPFLVVRLGDDAGHLADSDRLFLC